MRNGCVCATGLFLSLGPAFHCAAAEPPPIDAYASIPAIQEPRLSPDGLSLAFLMPVKDKLSLIIRKVSGGTNKVLDTGEAEPDWILWKTDQRLMASLRFTAFSANNEYALHTRLAFTDADGGNVVFAKLNQELEPGAHVAYDRSNHTPQFQNRIISAEPDKPDEILMAVTPLNDWIHPDVMRVDVHSGLARTIDRESGVTRWLADDKDEVRAGIKIKAEHWTDKQTHRVVIAREHQGDPWQVIDEGDENKGHRFSPVAFAKDRRSILYVLADNDQGRLEGREYDLAAHALGAVVASNKGCDVEIFGTPQEYRGFDVPCEKDGRHYFDPDWQHDFLVIKKNLKADQVWVLDRSADGKRALFSVRRNPSEPVNYWFLDRRAEKPELTMLGEPYEKIPLDQIQPTKLVTYSARDGQTIPAYITLPANHSGPVPFVVLVHGGPSASDSASFNWTVQFLVSRGYGVFQPQFRGSTSFGTPFLEAGYQQWGGLMQDDVTDGTRWLIGQNLAEPGRICIAGSGYGGYSALMGTIKEPSLYACAAAYGPITDLNKLIRFMRAFAFYDVNAPRVKSESQDADDISPVEHAAEIKVPVLLVHGKKDVNIPFEHSEDMAKALKRAGKPVTVVYSEEGNAGKSHSAERRLWLSELEKLLDANLKTPGSAATGAAKAPAGQ